MHTETHDYEEMFQMVTGLEPLSVPGIVTELLADRNMDTRGRNILTRVLAHFYFA